MPPNKNITVRIHRNFTTKAGEHAAKLQYHEQRATLMHELAEELSLEVANWGKTDLPSPKEVVSVVLSTRNQGVFTTMAERFKSWIDGEQVQDVVLEFPNGGRVALRKGNVAQAEKLATENGLFKEQAPEE